MNCHGHSIEQCRYKTFLLSQKALLDYAGLDNMTQVDQISNCAYESLGDLVTSRFWFIRSGSGDSDSVFLTSSLVVSRLLIHEPLFNNRQLAYYLTSYKVLSYATERYITESAQESYPRKDSPITNISKTNLGFYWLPWRVSQRMQFYSLPKQSFLKSFSLSLSTPFLILTFLPNLYLKPSLWNLVGGPMAKIMSLRGGLGVDSWSAS